MKIKKFYFKSINSTNDKAIKIIKKTQIKFGIIIAETQKKGRGRYGKKWISIKGNLFMTIFFCLDKIDKSLSELTKINCELVKKVLSRYTKEKIAIKSPNDLMIKKKKFCGILQEKINKSNKNFMIVGIGVNLFKNPDIIKYPTTHLFKYSNIKITKGRIVRDLVDMYQKKLNDFVGFKNLKDLKC